uniref:B-cell receptor CD22 n=1 Tax=Poecilia formosa TaxID=48698 RepID=A0A087XDT7_POEFO
MFVFIWLIVSLPSNNVTDALQWTNPCHMDGYCVAFNEGEIRAEAGLCAVIPCAFTSLFAPEHIIWYKCESYQDRCDNSKEIFHSDKNKENIQPGFKGRVSLVEPDVAQKNCSIIINDLKESDSGRYQLRIEGKVTGEAFSYKEKPTLLVTELNQKPSMMIPPLTEGQQVTLTCTAPGLCSGSPPKITWMWRGKGKKDSHIIGNTSALKTENLTAFTKRHVSTLTFNSSADHHNTKITCKVSFTGGITTEETVTLNVTYVRKPQISGRTTVKEGDDLNLTCSVDSVPPSVIKWTKSGTETNWQENSGHVSLSIMNVTAEGAGRYICTATYQNDSMTEEIQVKVNYRRRPQITGNQMIKEGDALNLTCSVDSVPPSLIMWTKNSLSMHPSNRTSSPNNTGSATLVVFNMTVGDSGQYICAATYENITETTYVDVKVTWAPKVLNGSECVLRSDVLTCVCLSEGFPLPTIQWPLLKGHTEYSITRVVSNHTVNSTVTITVENHGNISVECVSSNGNGEAKENLTVLWTKGEGTVNTCATFNFCFKVLIAVGFLLAPIIFCLFMKFYRYIIHLELNLHFQLQTCIQI